MVDRLTITTRTFKEKTMKHKSMIVQCLVLSVALVGCAADLQWDNNDDERTVMVDSDQIYLPWKDVSGGLAACPMTSNGFIDIPSACANELFVDKGDPPLDDESEQVLDNDPPSVEIVKEEAAEKVGSL